jgi:glycolate oxidase FAD binding subunit
MTVLRPADLTELSAAIADAAAGGARLMIRGGGSKDGIGRDSAAATLDMRGFSGMVDYDPAELVLTARAGTPIADIAALVGERDQHLAFDPLDPGPLFGRDAGQATLGGAVASGLSGSLRLAHGAVRDHVLGFEGVSGRGEVFVAGGRVVKNVTGFDLSKLVAGSWGRLVALTSITIKVLPRPRVDRTLRLAGLDPRRAVAAMASAMGSPAEVSAAAHLPEEATLFRLRGFAGSVAAREALLRDRLADFGTLEADAAASWSPTRLDGTLWRVHIAPSRAASLVERLEPTGARWWFDWAGALVWLACEDAGAVRAAADAAGGHAMLVRAAPGLRGSVAALHPPSPGVAALEERVRRSFDPAGVFETGRF